MEWTFNLSAQPPIGVSVAPLAGRPGSYIITTQKKSYLAHWNSFTKTFLVSDYTPTAQDHGITLETCCHIRNTSSMQALSQHSEKKLTLEVSALGGISFVRSQIVPISISRQKKDKQAKDTAFKSVSPITGKVLKVLAQHGNKVGEGEVVVIIEAMKMENKICTESSGVLTNIGIKEGDNVKMGDELFTVEFTQNFPSVDRLA